MDNQDHFSFVIREFKFEVQQVAGRNNGSKIFSNWLYILSPSLGRGKEGKGFSDVKPSLCKPDIVYVSNRGHRLHF
jgi:hypothetical protein